jgi:hypothetical protein
MEHIAKTLYAEYFKFSEFNTQVTFDRDRVEIVADELYKAHKQFYKQG